MSDSKNKLLLRLITPKGIVYEKFISFVTVCKEDGLMVVNKNYSSILEKLPKGNVVINESSKNVSFSIDEGWLTVLNNRCEIYSFRAEIV